MEGESIEAEPLPEEWAMEGKSIAVEREGAGSHEAARTTKGGPSKAAAKGRPGKATAAKAAVNGRRAPSRGGRGNRRGGQSSHYAAHHDAPPFIRRRTPAFKYETRQFPPGCSVRHCRLGGEQPGAMKRHGRTDPNADEKTLRHGVPESQRGRDRGSRSVADVQNLLLCAVMPRAKVSVFQALLHCRTRWACYLVMVCFVQLGRKLGRTSAPIQPSHARRARPSRSSRFACGPTLLVAFPLQAALDQPTNCLRDRGLVLLPLGPTLDLGPKHERHTQRHRRVSPGCRPTSTSFFWHCLFS